MNPASPTPAPTQHPAKRPRNARAPLNLIALFVPGIAFAVELFLVRDDPRFAWLRHPAQYPWQLWVIAICGVVATIGGVADWRFHRSGATAIGKKEHDSELAALAGGGMPLFVVMSVASVLRRPNLLLLPAILLVVFTTVLICYDEFVFHRKRCGRYETVLHRMLVYGNFAAWLSWAHWCFVHGGAYANS